MYLYLCVCILNARVLNSHSYNFAHFEFLGFCAATIGVVVAGEVLLQQRLFLRMEFSSLFPA